MNILTTDHERSLLELMATGHTDSAIARRLNVGKRTLERQLAGLMARVGAPSRLALGAIAAQHRWIDIDNLLRCGEHAVHSDNAVSAGHDPIDGSCRFREIHV